MTWHQQKAWVRGLPLLGGIWLMGAASDRLWFALDHSVPAWDQADYLTGALNYWQALQSPQWGSPDWWTDLWTLSSKVPPLTYIATALVMQLFGRGLDQATLVNLGFSAILLASVYLLATRLFSVRVGLWAAGLCLLFPGLYRARLDFLLDYPLTAMVTLCFTCLTLWRWQTFPDLTPKTWWGSPQPFHLRESLIRWLLTIATGISLGLAFLVKQPALFFLLVPFVWVVRDAIVRRAWGALVQIAVAIGLAGAVVGPWYRTNWLLMLTSGKRATIDSAIAEGDPSLLSLDAWTFYLKDLPQQTSWWLLIVPLIGLGMYGRFPMLAKFPGRSDKRIPFSTASQRQGIQQRGRSLIWLVGFWVGAYLLCSLNINKDPRYAMPYLPVLAILLAYGLLLLPHWGFRWGAVVLTGLVLGINLSPGLATNLSLFIPHAQHIVYRGAEFPHTQVIGEILKTEPYLQNTLGVLPSTPEVNQHNLNYFGALNDFRVYGRQVGTRKSQVAQESRSLSWFLTKTKSQGSIRQQEAQQALTRTVEQGGEFQLHRIWELPDGSKLKLLRRQAPPVVVTPLAATDHPSRLRLEKITLPEAVPPGQPVPIVYQWTGNWETLRSGIVLLTWQHQGSPGCPELGTATSRTCWLHDHGIALGSLYAGAIEPEATQSFQVVESIAMLPPETTVPGVYTLTATYVNRKTGATYPIDLPPTKLTLSPNTAPTPAPELDWVTQLRTVALALPRGIGGLQPIFDTVGQLNQYDPTQDYLKQTRIALLHRLEQAPNNVELAYTLALVEVLQRQIDPAIAALQRVIQLDPENPNAYAYLAFVNLYDFRAGTARSILQPALTRRPDSPELHGLNAIAALMQGNLVQAWQSFQKAQEVTNQIAG